MDRLYLEPAGHDASEVEVESRIVAAERQPAPAAGTVQAMAVGRHHDQRNVVHHPRQRHELSIWPGLQQLAKADSHCQLVKVRSAHRHELHTIKTTYGQPGRSKA